MAFLGETDPKGAASEPWPCVFFETRRLWLAPCVGKFPNSGCEPPPICNPRPLPSHYFLPCLWDHLSPIANLFSTRSGGAISALDPVACKKLHLTRSFDSYASRSFKSSNSKTQSFHPLHNSKEGWQIAVQRMGKGCPVECIEVEAL